MAAPALDAHELYRFYRVGDEEIFVLRGVGLSVEAGATLAVVGPSGSGKSTLLACLAGLDEPDGGTVRVAGLRISRQPEQVRARLRREHVGMLFQSGNLMPHLTVLENVRLSQAPGATGNVPDPLTLLTELGIATRAHAEPATSAA